MRVRLVWRSLLMWVYLMALILGARLAFGNAGSVVPPSTNPSPDPPSVKEPFVPEPFALEPKLPSPPTDVEVVIKSDPPGAAVWIDEVDRGKTDASGWTGRLAPKEGYKLRLVLPGYRTVEDVLNVRADRNNAPTFQLVKVIDGPPTVPVRPTVPATPLEGDTLILVIRNHALQRGDAKLERGLTALVHDLKGPESKHKVLGGVAWTVNVDTKEEVEWQGRQLGGEIRQPADAYAEALKTACAAAERLLKRRKDAAPPGGVRVVFVWKTDYNFDDDDRPTDDTLPLPTGAKVGLFYYGRECPNGLSPRASDWFRKDLVCAGADLPEDFKTVFLDNLLP